MTRNFLTRKREIVTATDVINMLIILNMIDRIGHRKGKPALDMEGHDRYYVYKFTCRSSFENKRIIPYSVIIKICTSLGFDEYQMALFLFKAIHEKFVRRYYRNEAGYRANSFYPATKDVDFIKRFNEKFLDYVLREITYIRIFLWSHGYTEKQVQYICETMASKYERLLFDRPCKKV